MSLHARLGLKDGERLVTVARAAAVTRFFPSLIAIALIAGPFFGLVPLLRIETLGYIIMGLSWALGLFLALRLWIVWHGTLLAVTDRRLIVVRRKGFFDRQATEVPFAKIHEVAYRVKGVAATLFGYGTLTVETAGGEKPLEIGQVSHPAALKDLVVEQQEEAGRGPGDFGRMLEAVSSMDARHLKLLKAEVDRTLRLHPDGDAL